ncbi:MAG: hypothetical protein Aurels2KO_09370 [Aureliella sp.]
MQRLIHSCDVDARFGDTVKDLRLNFAFAHFTPQLVDRVVGCNSHKPGCWLVGNSTLSPGNKGAGKGDLDGIFGQRQVPYTKPSHQHRNDACGFMAEEVID